MTRISTFAAVAALSLIGAPAFAQQYANAGTDNAATAASCQRMIRQMNAALPSLNAARRTEAKAHVDSAKSALEQNNAAACIASMQTALASLR
jgi:uncharacterized protein YdeI (BOF family)